MVGRRCGSPLLLVDLRALLTALPVPAGKEMPRVTPALKLLSLIQPLVLMSAAVLIGVALASKVGLSSPVAEAAASIAPRSIRRSRIAKIAGLTPVLSPQILGIIGEFCV